MRINVSSSTRLAVLKFAGFCLVTRNYVANAQSTAITWLLYVRGLEGLNANSNRNAADVAIRREGIGPLDIPIITRASNVNPWREQQRISTYKQYPLIFAEFNLGRRAHPRALARSLAPTRRLTSYVHLGGTGRCFVTRNFVTRPVAGSGSIVDLREFRRRYDRLTAAWHFG